MDSGLLQLPVDHRSVMLATNVFDPPGCEAGVSVGFGEERRDVAGAVVGKVEALLEQLEELLLLVADLAVEEDEEGREGEGLLAGLDVVADG